MYSSNVCLIKTANDVLFYRHVACFALLLGYKKEWRLGDFGLLFARVWRHDNPVFEHSSSTQPGDFFSHL